jgi:integrase
MWNEDFSCKVGHFSDSIRALKHKIAMKRHRFPIIVKRGSSHVKIYRDRKPTGTYYRVVYHLGGKRHRLNFNDFEKATVEAEAKAAQLSRGDVDAMQLSGKDRLVYGRALEAIREHGVPLDAVAFEYAQARQLLNDVPLLDAARFYARHHGAGIKRKLVGDAVEEMIAAKTRKGVSDVYLADLQYRLGKFARTFKCDVNTITPDDIAGFFLRLSLSPRSHNNFALALRTFFRFAQRHGWLAKEVDLLERVERRSEKRSPVGIFTPTELATILEHASPTLAPCLALGAFAGLRSAEILRLEWSDTQRHPGFIEVAAHKAKTATRRIVPVSDNLGKWLAITPRNGERVWPHSKGHFIRETARAARHAKLRWKANGLRHSFISYRLGEIHDVNGVALEAGNSPAMIFRHYRELATPEQARSWFTIAPEAGTNVVPLTARVALQS